MMRSLLLMEHSNPNFIKTKKPKKEKSRYLNFILYFILRKQNFWTVNKKPSGFGTLNPAAFEQPMFQNHLTRNATYEELANLSKVAEDLQQKNSRLNERMKLYANECEGNPFRQFKKFQLMLDKRISERESELKDFSDHFKSFRTSTDPTFVEVNASKVRTPSFDPIILSLLVSNEQKKFFQSKDIKEQNDQLRHLITMQKEALSLLNGRLKMFNQFEAEFSIQNALKSLQKGVIPATLTGMAPSLALELRTKHKMLMNEKSAIVTKRRMIQKERVLKKLKRREMRIMNNAAVTIQALFRGYRVRRRARIVRVAATMIQRYVRGFLARDKYAKLRKSNCTSDEIEEEDRNEVMRFRMMSSKGRMEKYTLLSHRSTQRSDT